MGWIVLVIIIVVIFAAFSKRGRAIQEEVVADPCIEQIVQYVKTVQGITAEVSSSSSWIDIYSSEKTIVCRYYNFEGCTELRMIDDYQKNSYPNKESMIEFCKQKFDENFHFSSFPKGTQLEIQDASEGSFQILFTVVPAYPYAIHSYRNPIANAIRNAGITFTDTDRKGSFDPNRIYIR